MEQSPCTPAQNRAPSSLFESFRVSGANLSGKAQSTMDIIMYQQQRAPSTPNHPNANPRPNPNPRARRTLLIERGAINRVFLGVNRFLYTPIGCTEVFFALSQYEALLYTAILV